MAWIVRPLAAMSVFLGVVAAAYFTQIPAAPASPPVTRFRTLSSLHQLPADWATGAVAFLESQRLPLSHDEIRHVVRVVETEAVRHGADPLTILAVIQVESRFDPWAVSPRSALGLMQVRPSTAREIAPRLGIRWTSDDLLFDPEINVAIGTYYLMQMLERFDGNLATALAAYEAGPGRIQARLALSEEPPLNYADRVWDAIAVLQARVLA